ncbi:unnamed protein product [Nezara viridula]|uniref:Acyltransferase n=1 Tax=Nezara viridula TaxID=85310 RepID=A0A9P0MF64_NEZVI|nr:unnamed protein product [Nezara viridula]
MLTTLERCFQVLAAVYYGILISLHLTLLLLMLYITFFTKYWYIILVLVLWTWFDKETPFKGGRRLWICGAIPILRYLRDYFPVTLIKTAELDPNRNYMFCNHPHGFFSTGIFVNFLTQFSPKNQLFPNLKFYLAAVDSHLTFPLLRDLFLGFGFISSSKRSLAFLLNNTKKGNVVNLNVGGGEEIIYSIPGQYKLILKRRKGFIKLALNLGCCLVPVIHFGLNDIYEVLKPIPGTILYKLLQVLKHMTGMVIALPVGDYGIPCIPKRRPITTIVGKPVEIPKIEEPTQEQIDYYHTLYTEELMKLFEEEKHKYVKDSENVHLVVEE